MFPPADSQGSGLALWWLEWRVRILLQLQSVLKISVSFCSISSWPIPASSFPAVTTVCTLFQRTSEMGWKWFLPLTSLSPGGQQGIPTSQHKKEFWETNSGGFDFFSRTYSWNLPCGSTSATAEHRVEVLCVPTAGTVCWDPGREGSVLSHVQLCTTCHPGLSPPASGSHTALVLARWSFKFCFSFCILHEWRCDLSSILENWVWHLLLNGLAVRTPYLCAGQNFRGEQNHGSVLLLLPSILPEEPSLSQFLQLVLTDSVAAWGCLSFN